MAGEPAGQKMGGMHKQVGLTKSGSKQSKKNLLNQNSNDSVGMNPYLLEINKQMGGQPQNQHIPPMYNNFQGAQPGFQQVQSQKQLMKGQHKKSESIDFVNGNGYQKIGQYQAKHIGAQQVQNNQKQFRKNMREHNKSIGAIPDSNSVLGLGSSDSLGLVAGGLEARNKHSVDSADLLQRNMQRNQINTIDQNNLQNLSSGSIQMGSLAISNNVNQRDSFPKNGLASSIQNLQKVSNNSIIINAKAANQEKHSLRRQLGQQQPQSKPQLPQGDKQKQLAQGQQNKQQAIQVVRNQINIINNKHECPLHFNNQGQQIFSKDGFPPQGVNEYNELEKKSSKNSISGVQLRVNDPQFKTTNVQNISNKNKQYLMNQNPSSQISNVQTGSTNKLKRSGGSQQSMQNIKQVMNSAHSHSQMQQQSRKMSNQNNQIQILLNQN